MTTFVLGDIHGCFATLERLLEALRIDWERDRLWLVGDLVNRGPASLETLRWARRTAARLGSRFVSVLGNHDLHLLGRDLGVAAPGRRDTLDEVLAAADRRELVEWLAGRPFVHRDRDALLVHAGLLPTWSRDDAESLGRSAARRLADPGERRGLLEEMREAEPVSASARAAAVFTRVRTLDRSETLSSFSGTPGSAPAGFRPWFELPGRWREATPVLFGHWAALGLYRGDGVVGLDSGCVWGRALSALRLEDGTIHQQPAVVADAPERNQGAGSSRAP